VTYLDAEQRAILREITAGSYRSGLKGRARRKARNTAIATGLVESHLHNLAGGDRDSEGWRQERKQFYKNPRNVRASVDRFFQEYKADAPKGGSISQRAQAVQQSAFPSRYGDVAAEARRLGKLFDKGGGGPGRSGGQLRRPSYIKGRDEFDAKAFIRDNLLGKPVKGRLEHSATSSLLRELANPNSAYRTTTPSKLKGGTVAREKNKLGHPETGHGVGKGKIFEEFYDNLPEYFDDGVVHKGAIGGHKDHVHVAGDPKYVVKLGKLAQRWGLHVGENPHFGGVSPVHVKGSFHYDGRAIDVSGSPELMAKFARYVRHRAR